MQGAARRGTVCHPRQQQPGHDHDGSRDRGPHLRGAADAGDPRADHRTREAGRDPPHGRWTDRAQPGDCARRTGHAREVRRRVDRRVSGRDQTRRGPAAVPRRDARDRRRRAAQHLLPLAGRCADGG